MGRTFSLGSRFRYPSEVTRIFKLSGPVDREEPLFEYAFRWVKEIHDTSRHETRFIEERSVGVWESPAEGTIAKWHIVEGQTLARDRPVVVIDEVCSHEVQFQGMCGQCGKDMTEVSRASDAIDASRATINMTHDETSLMVSKDLAARTEHDAQRRLLKQHKLSLVVDLDQTIIHACVEPTVGEWQADPSNPNHDAVREVRSFQLDDGPRGLASGCFYYIKVRPGCREFLEDVSQMYELHIYTMATRAYAMNIAKIVDPDGKLFGNRIISRDENGTMASKSLQRLFPVSTNMVAIIDDRSDMWPLDRDHLIKVAQYDFFTGIGDINSSFLPTRQDFLASAPAALAALASNGTLATTNGSAKAGTEDAVNKPLVAEENTCAQEKQAAEQIKTLEKQLVERPLQHLQEALDKEAGAQQDEAGGAGSSQGSQARQNLLRDEDEELVYLQEHLRKLHDGYFSRYNAMCDAAGKPRADEAPRDSAIDVSLAPDVGLVLSLLKSKVLRGVVVVLSGIVPVDVDVHRTETGLQITSFGATLHNRITKDTTHLVIAAQRARTHKVQQAASMLGIKIVNHSWLKDCLSRWKRLDEKPYLIRVSRSRKPDQEAPDTNEETEARGSETPLSDRPRLSIVDAHGERQELEMDEDESEADGETSSEPEPEPEPEPEGQGEGADDMDVDEGLLLKSPVPENFDWDAVNAELAEFMTSEDDESSDADGQDGAEAGGDDNDLDGSQSKGNEPSAPASREESPKNLKRKADDDTDNGNGNGNGTPSPDGGSALSRKRRLAKTRDGTSLGETQAPGGGGQAVAAEDESEEQDIDEDELEREMMEALEAEDKS